MMMRPSVSVLTMVAGSQSSCSVLMRWDRLDMETDQRYQSPVVGSGNIFWPRISMRNRVILDQIIHFVPTWHASGYQTHPRTSTSQGIVCNPSEISRTLPCDLWCLWCLPTRTYLRSITKIQLTEARSQWKARPPLTNTLMSIRNL